MDKISDDQLEYFNDILGMARQKRHSRANEKIDLINIDPHDSFSSKQVHATFDCVVLLFPFHVIEQQTIVSLFNCLRAFWLKGYQHRSLGKSHQNSNY